MLLQTRFWLLQSLKVLVRFWLVKAYTCGAASDLGLAEPFLRVGFVEVAVDVLKYVFGVFERHLLAFSNSVDHRNGQIRKTNLIHLNY